MRSAIVVAIMLAASGASAQQGLEYSRYRAEIENPGPQWVVISYHFRHGADCTSLGCVIVGPTESQEACEEWATLYNSGDPYDHVRCTSAANYNLSISN